MRILVVVVVVVVVVAVVVVVVDDAVAEAPGRVALEKRQDVDRGGTRSTGGNRGDS
jgi:hypothetical protein